MKTNYSRTITLIVKLTNANDCVIVKVWWNLKFQYSFYVAGSIE